MTCDKVDDFSQCSFLILRYSARRRSLRFYFTPRLTLTFLVSTCNPCQTRSSTEVSPSAKKHFLGVCVPSKAMSRVSSIALLTVSRNLAARVWFVEQHRPLEKVWYLDVVVDCIQNEVFFHGNLRLCKSLSIDCKSKGGLFCVHRTKTWVYVHMDATMYDSTHFSSFHTSVLSYTVIAQEKVAFGSVAKGPTHTMPCPHRSLFDWFLVSPKFVQHWCPYFRDKKALTMVRLGPVIHMFHLIFPPSSTFSVFWCFFVDWDDRLSSFPSPSSRTCLKIWTDTSPNGNDTWN